MKILVITEQREGKWNPVSFETLVAAQQIAAAQTGSRVAAAVIGKGVRALADELAANQLAEVLLVEHDLLERYTPDGFTIALAPGSRPVPARSGALFPTPIRCATSRPSWPRRWAKE